MGDISNFEINKRSNVERPNLRVTTIENGKYENQPNCEWCKISKERTISNFFNFWNFDSFPNSKNSENLLIFYFGKIYNLANWPISQIAITDYFGK